MTEYSAAESFASDLKIGPDEIEPEEMQTLAIMVTEALQDGDSHEEIATDLVNGGWTQEEADQFVVAIDYQLDAVEASSSNSAGEGNWGWLVWIAVFILFKLLQRMF